MDAKSSALWGGCPGLRLLLPSSFQAEVPAAVSSSAGWQISVREPDMTCLRRHR